MQTFNLGAQIVMCTLKINKTRSKLLYNSILKIAITFPNVFLLYIPANTVYQHYFISFVDTLLSTALHPSFH